MSRTDLNTSLSETFTYDNLNRVTSATVSQNAPVKTFAYDASFDRLRRQPAVGVRCRAYAYPLAGAALPHADDR
jgi:hypothetical protein